MHFPEFLTKPKRITSKRLGIAYTKDFVYVQRSDYYLIVRSNLTRISFKPQCIQRFDRLIRSPSSNNRSFLVIDRNRQNFRKCKHLPGKPLELDLTSLADSYFKQIEDDSIEIDLTQLANSYFDLD